jgi:hypothetical protein
MLGASRLGGYNGNFTPLALNPWAWLDASSSQSAYVNLTGTTVNSWIDLSGNGRNASSTGTSRPSYTASWQNGLGAISFSGTGSGNILDFTSPSITGTNNISFFFVGQPNYVGASSRYQRALSMAGVDINNAQDYNSLDGMLYAPVSTTNAYEIYRNSTAFGGGNTYTNNTKHLWGFTAGGTTYSNWLDGGSAKTGTNYNATNLNTVRVRIGSDVARVDSNFNGQIGEWVLFTRKLSQTEVDQMFGYLAWKWGLQANLPSTQPYKNSPP